MFAEQGRHGARPRRPDRPAQPDVLRRDDAGARRSPPRSSTASAATSPSTAHLSVGTADRARHPAAPAARPAPGALQRPRRRDDRAGQLRPGLRGARPAVADPGEARRRRPARRPPRRWSSTTSRSATRAPTRSRWPRSRRVARTESRDSGEVLHDLSFAAEPGQMVALVGPSGAGKTTITHLVARLYDADRAAPSGSAAHDVRDVTLQSLEDAVGYVTQDAHMFHDTIRENLLYARPERRPTSRSGPPSRRPRSRHLVRSLPDGLDTVVGDRGYRLSGGERQRLAIARLLLKAPPHRRPRRGDRPPRQRVRGRRPAGARRGARRPHVAGDRPPALHGARRRPDPGRRGRPDRPARHPRAAARARAASTPTSTAPSS